MTTYSIKGLSMVAALLLVATALPAAAQRHNGGGDGGGGGGHAGAGGGHVNLGGGGGRASIGAHGSSGALHVQRSGIARAHVSHGNAVVRNRHATTRASHNTVRANHTTRHERAAAKARHDRATATAARENRATRKAQTAQQNRATRVSARTARQGRFAARFNARHNRVAFRPNRWAWRHGWYAGFVPWYGPVFWPYAYADIFGFAFWPYGYDPGYWYYAYDDFFDGVFYGDVGRGSAYASAGRGSSRIASATKASAKEVAQLCKQPDEGLTAWPTTEINSKLQLNDEQKALFDDLQAAGKKAADTFAASCPPDNNFAATPPGRLQAMTARLDATLQAVDTVKPALDKFYASLSDEQKARFNELGPKQSKVMASRQRAETQGSGSQASNCGDPKPGLANLPIERIDDAVKPNETQQAGLKQLEDATSKAVATLQAACPDEVPATPPARLDAMETRLKAMIEAANTVKPALENFYGSLDNEQKARFNRLGSQLSASNG
jgi:hypothetical protein